MARALWKAILTIPDGSHAPLEIPAKLYGTVRERDVSFRLVHKKDGVPVQQRWIDSETRDEVPWAEVRRAIALDKDTLVAMSPEELAAGEPEASRAITVEAFVPPEAVDVGWYAQPYLLGPDGDDAGYAALVTSLGKDGRLGLARWVMRGKRRRGALLVRGPHLVLVSFHAADEVIPAALLEAPAGAGPSEAERKLADQLVAALDAPLDVTQLHDDYRARVLKLVTAKAHGKKLRVAEPRAPRSPSSMTAALQASLRRAKEKKVA